MSEQAKIITGAEEIGQLRSLMRSNDAEYQQLFTSLKDKTENLVDSEVSSRTKYETIVSIEFILVRLRIIITEEQVKVKAFLGDKQSLPPLWVPYLKGRDATLAGYHQKLHELRDDIATLQKAIYTKNSYTFK